MEQMSTEAWLAEVLSEELDVRPPKSNHEREAKHLSRTPHVTLYGERRPAGHCELRRIGAALELATVIVDKEKRGIGLSHELVRIAIERAGQDPIISGQTMGSFTPPLVFCFTKSAALATTLTKAGFRIQPARRRASRLFLWKSASANLPIRVQIHLAGVRFVRFLILLSKHRHKAMAQAGNLSNYHLFTRIAGASVDDGGKREPLTSGDVTALGMNVVRVTEKDFEKDDESGSTAVAEPETVHSWDNDGG